MNKKKLGQISKEKNLPEFYKKCLLWVNVSKKRNLFHQPSNTVSGHWKKVLKKCQSREFNLLMIAYFCIPLVKFQ